MQSSCVEMKTLLYASGQGPVKARTKARDNWLYCVNITHLKQFGMLKLSKNIPSEVLTVLVS
jgi:hypothetical protein